MMLSGQAIIFETENEAKLWYETIKDFKKSSAINSENMKMESWLEMNERFKREE